MHFAIGAQNPTADPIGACVQGPRLAGLDQGVNTCSLSTQRFCNWDVVRAADARTSTQLGLEILANQPDQKNTHFRFVTARNYYLSHDSCKPRQVGDTLENTRDFVFPDAR